jgi:hypothetical protein
MNNHQIILYLFILIASSAVHANENFVAKVIIVKGHVSAKFQNGDLIEVKQDQNISEETILTTSEKSFVKLSFIDKSQLNLGPNSQMVINVFPKDNPGIISLLKGQLRSKVTKDYMNIEDKNKSKLFIKTQTAAMGVRGTDFQVNFNPLNLNSSLITFEGKVAMANIEKSDRLDHFDQVKLESIVSSEKAVMVERGQISAVNLNITDRAMTPTLLAPTQVNALANNENGLAESGETNKKQFRNPIPHGVDGTLFSNLNTTKDNIPNISTNNNSNGFFHAESGEYKLPAGSIVDLKTLNIIPPPANAVFDPNTKTFIVPENFGKINKDTGEYTAPIGLHLGTNGKFIVIDSAAFAKTQVINKDDKRQENQENNNENTKQENSDRVPSSINETTVPPSSPSVQTEIPKVYEAIPEIPAVGLSDALRKVALERISTIENARQAAVDLGKASTSRNLKFVLKAK